MKRRAEKIIENERIQEFKSMPKAYKRTGYLSDPEEGSTQSMTMREKESVYIPESEGEEEKMEQSASSESEAEKFAKSPTDLKTQIAFALLDVGIEQYGDVKNSTEEKLAEKIAATDAGDLKTALENIKK